MFASLEKKATVLAAGILVATVLVGKMFGGRLIGLIPLGMCLSSGVFLWMKEVIRSGREVEWDSEKTRGQVVCISGDNSVSRADYSHHGRRLRTSSPNQSNG
jgi:hypothetical protein